MSDGLGNLERKQSEAIENVLSMAGWLYAGVKTTRASAYTRNYVNPLEADLSQVNEKGICDVIADKSEFMLGLCDQLLGSALNQKHHSIIDRCVKDLYFDAWRNRKVPLMSDFYHILKSQEETEAQNLRSVCLLPDMKMLCLESLNRLKSNNLRRSITVG